MSIIFSVSCVWKICCSNDLNEDECILFMLLYSALGGDLHRHCVAYDTDEPASSRSEREVVFLLRQILEGVKHLHERDFVHLDIKVGNACILS